MKLDIVLQGSVVDVTYDVVEKYSKLEFVNKIILSSYTFDGINLPSNVTFINNEMIDPTGIKNRNLQLNTSRNGLCQVKTECCIKMRCDQFIHIESMNKLYDFWMKHKDEYIPPGYLTPRGKIFVMGLYQKHVYHPRDHVYWGYTEDIKNFFSIPFDNTPNVENYDQFTRSEAYLAQFYYARYNPSVYKHILNPQTFIVDNSPRKEEALKLDNEIKSHLFKVFPRVNMRWPKYGIEEYNYSLCNSIESEYWAD